MLYMPSRCRNSPAYPMVMPSSLEYISSFSGPIQKMKNRVEIFFPASTMDLLSLRPGYCDKVGNHHMGHLES
jgi:hypothetical protein